MAEITNQECRQGHSGRGAQGRRCVYRRVRPRLRHAGDGEQPWPPTPSSSPWPTRCPRSCPTLAKEAGAAVVGTGRSDFPNQINNVLAFPGIFRGALDVRASDINDEMKIAAAKAIAGFVHRRQAVRRLHHPQCAGSPAWRPPWPRRWPRPPGKPAWPGSNLFVPSPVEPRLHGAFFMELPSRSGHGQAAHGILRA